MELVTFDGSRIISLFLVGRAMGSLPTAKMSAAVVERYNFRKFPTQVSEFDADKVEYTHGVFGDNRIDALEIYGDGIIVSGRVPTETLDAFIEDLTTWADRTFDFKRYETQKPNKIYESAILLKSKRPLLRVLESLRSLQTGIRKSLSSATGIDAEFEPFGIVLGPDTTKLPGMKPIQFRVERRVGVSFESDLYYSAAPIPTADHLRLLEQLESSV